jgi:hypothetical protein
MYVVQELALVKQTQKQYKMKILTETELATSSFIIEVQFYNFITIFYPVPGSGYNTNTGG